jgi:hypothetical protein
MFGDLVEHAGVYTVDPWVERKMHEERRKSLRGFMNVKNSLQL